MTNFQSLEALRAFLKKNFAILAVCDDQSEVCVTDTDSGEVIVVYRNGRLDANLMLLPEYETTPGATAQLIPLLMQL